MGAERGGGAWGLGHIPLCYTSEMSSLRKGRGEGKDVIVGDRDDTQP